MRLCPDKRGEVDLRPSEEKVETWFRTAIEVRLRRNAFGTCESSNIKHF